MLWGRRHPGLLGVNSSPCVSRPGARPGPAGRAVGKCLQEDEGHGSHVMWPISQWLVPVPHAEGVPGQWLHSPRVAGAAWIVTTYCQPPRRPRACGHRGRPERRGEALVSASREVFQGTFGKEPQVLKVKCVGLPDPGCPHVKQLTHWLLNGASVLLPFRFVAYFYLFMVFRFLVSSSLLYLTFPLSLFWFCFKKNFIFGHFSPNYWSYLLCFYTHRRK